MRNLARNSRSNGTIRLLFNEQVVSINCMKRCYRFTLEQVKKLFSFGDLWRIDRDRLRINADGFTGKDERKTCRWGIFIEQEIVNSLSGVAVFSRSYFLESIKSIVSGSQFSNF